VSGLGDVNGDLVPDLVVAASHANPGGLADAGSVWVFSGLDRTLLHRFDDTAAGELFGSSLANVGDLDGDGVNDLAIGARAAGPGGRTAAGSVFVHSGASGALLFRFDGAADGDLLGTSVAAAGDVDRDGVPDVLAGAPLADPNGVGAAGSAFLFSGLSGERIARLDGREPGAILASAAGTGPTTLQGLLVPLTSDPLFRQTLKRRFPPQAGHFRGTLGPAGDAAAVFQAAPGALPAKLLGRTVFLAAVNRNFDFASVARSLAFVP